LTPNLIYTFAFLPDSSLPGSAQQVGGQASFYHLWQYSHRLAIVTRLWKLPTFTLTFCTG